jgi:hypothetical protein
VHYIFPAEMNMYVKKIYYIYKLFGLHGLQITEKLWNTVSVQVEAMLSKTCRTAIYRSIYVYYHNKKIHASYARNTERVSAVSPDL